MAKQRSTKRKKPSPKPLEPPNPTWPPILEIPEDAYVTFVDLDTTWQLTPGEVYDVPQGEWEE